MKKPLLYRLFKLGKLPKNIDKKKLSTFDEGVKVVAKYKNFKAPGKSFSNKTSGFIGSIAIGGNQIIAFAYSSPILKMATTDPRLQKIDFSESSDTVLSMHFDAASFSDNSSGMVTYKFHTPKAFQILDKLKTSKRNKKETTKM